MSESWFSDVDIDDIPDNPNDLPNNTYKFQVISAVLKPTGDGSKTGITFRYQIVDDPAWSNFFPLVDWVQVPDKNVPKDRVPRMLSYIKMHLLAFGFSQDQIKSFSPKTVEECIGKKFWGTTSSRKDETSGRTNIKVVKFDALNDGANTAVDMGEDF